MFNLRVCMKWIMKNIDLKKCLHHWLKTLKHKFKCAAKHASQIENL